MISHNSNGRHILVVDDEPLVRRSLSKLLTISGYTVSSVANGKEAIELLKNYNADIIITDIKMPQMDGLQLLKEVKKNMPEVPVILITSFGSIENAVEAIKQGAYDYVTKPIVDSEIKLVIERLIKERSLREENLRLKEQLSTGSRQRFHNIVGKDERMQKVYNLIDAVTNTRATVLIHGESGTGKRLVAHAVHKYNEQERGKPFVEVSCGALTETLLESELFGHVKGAFTGAIKDKVGRFELADGGSIFLDEIDAFSPALQVKLLRVLQEGEFERVGDNKTMKVDVRVIAATNQDLRELIEQGKFRQDLYYRLNIINIKVPPLRDRKGDIKLLVDDFVKKHTQHVNKKIEGVSEGALAVLMNYEWPGNVRELENVIERAIILSKGPVITPEDFPDFINDKQVKVNGNGNGNGLKLKDALASPEKDLILEALNSTNWNRNETAKTLGINRTTLYKKMHKYGLLKKKS
ncbi:MAG: sigma-54-dependent Fis family transcriptional regulator [Candidatus Omnitrophota bacterium]|nr:MAG: sigma-54-dependent Fis family transcriptional regulator [Candidatus Omnitrophota bacterium]